jgi:hypothetical protein
VNFLLAAVAVVALALAGVGVLGFVWPWFRPLTLPVKLALGYCVGSWLVTMLFFGAYLAGVSVSRWLVMGPVILLAGAGGLRCRSTISWPPPWREWILPTVFCLLALALSWSRPVYGYDAVMMWALKAKMMFFARTWPVTMFDPMTTAHTEYPPLVPSAQAFVFFWLGQFDDVASRVVFAAFYAAGAVILWYWLGRMQVNHRWVWVTWWCALPAVMEQVKLTYADLPLAVYLLVFYGAIVAWWREPGRRDWLWLAGIFGGMAFWVKQDALLGVGAGLVALAVAGKFSWELVVTAGLIAAPWRALVAVMNLPSDFTFTLVDLPVKTAQVAQALWQHAVIGGAYAFFWPVMLLTLIFAWRQSRAAESRWLTMAVVFNFVGVFAVYWFSKPNVPALLSTSLERVLLNLFVPALILVASLWRPPRPWSIVLIVSTIGLGVFEVYRDTRAVIELHREFGGKTVTQQHVIGVSPALRHQIAAALQAYPPGAHVQILPKRSLLRHQFYYETYPFLIVDNTATNLIELTLE